MKPFSSAATTAAAVAGIALLASATSPGFALELDATKLPSVSTINAPIEQNIPDPAPLPTNVPSSADVAAEDAGISGDTDAAQPATEAPISYASLADAVAAQSMPAVIDPELHCLAVGVYFEARSESLTGQLAVAEVILNRVDSPRFPNTVCGVLTQRSQFSFVRNGRLPTVDTSKPMWRNAVAVAQVARAQHWESPAADATFFHARHVSPRWRLAKVAAVGNHVFYR